MPISHVGPDPAIADSNLRIADTRLTRLAVLQLATNQVCTLLALQLDFGYVRRRIQSHISQAAAGTDPTGNQLPVNEDLNVRTSEVLPGATVGVVNAHLDVRVQVSI